MSYQHGKSSPGAIIQTVEQARRRNAELRIELSTLLSESAQLENHTSTMRLQVTAARRKLTRQIRELDAARAQADQIAHATAQTSTLPEPIYGGREGLQAAADEMRDYEERGLKLSKAPRPRIAKGPSHGTGRKYDQGCRCGECVTWKAAKDTRRQASKKLREQAAA